MIRPWVFEFMPELKLPGRPAEGQIAKYFADYLDLWAEDEALGFAGIFFSEHHFGYSFSSSPNLLIAALAQRTRRMRLGVMGVVLPYYHPARVIEELGILDQLTNGRLEIGTAVGIPQELARLNMTMAEARERNDEILEILDAAVAGKPVGPHAGKHFRFQDVRLLPPFAQPQPRPWTTVVSIGSARKAAQRHSRISTGFNSVGEIRELFDAYRDEAARVGFHVTPDDIAIRRRVIVAPTDAAARGYADAAASRFQEFVSHDSRLATNQIPDAPRAAGGFSISEDEFVSGVPSRVADEIRRQCEETGAGHFLSVFHWGAGFDEVSTAHRLFGEQVIPLLER